MACGSGFDYRRAEWKAVKAFPFVEYCIEKKGETVSPSQRVQLVYYGFETGGNLREDTLTEFPLFALNYLGQQLQQEAEFAALPVNTIGYMRVKSTEIMSIAQPIHFQLFYKNDPARSMMNRDSAVLDSLRVFSMINVIDKNEAAAMFGDENEIDWKELLDENPFPAMIELQLKAEYTRRASVDSVRQLLQQRFPLNQLEQVIGNYLPDGIDLKKAMPVFKFVVL